MNQNRWVTTTLAVILVAALAYSAVATSILINLSHDNSLLNSIRDNEALHSELIALLQSHIRSDYPEMKTALSDWERVKILRQWAHEHVDDGSLSAQLTSDQYEKFYGGDATTIFAMQAQDEGAPMCAGTAYALMKLYAAYGYQAYKLGVEVKGIMTHAETMVKINYEGKDVLTIQDATFDFTLVHIDGSPYDYFELLETLKSRQHNAVAIEEGTDVPSDFLFSKDEDIETADWIIWIVPGESPIPALSEGRLKLHCDMSIENWMEHKGNAIVDALVSQGYPHSLLYMYMQLLYIRWGDNAGELMDQANAILSAK